jgi:hypothetical protein
MNEFHAEAFVSQRRVRLEHDLVGEFMELLVGQGVTLYLAASPSILVRDAFLPRLEEFTHKRHFDPAGL